MTTEEKALALVNKVRTEYPLVSREVACDLALGRAIEQHEAFRQEVSDAAREYEEAGYCMGWEGFERFIIPAPKPDPLVEAFDAVWPGIDRTMVKAIRAALEARGLEIRSKADD